MSALTDILTEASVIKRSCFKDVFNNVHESRRTFHVLQDEISQAETFRSL
jgi:hypothetical protein